MTNKRQIKAEMLKRQMGLCYYCREPLKIELATLDHVLPRALGGTLKRSNLVIACGPCNVRKGHATPWDWVSRGLGRNCD
jgi:5-methylcytosine-specific restriction endonuclease McrA